MKFVFKLILGILFISVSVYPFSKPFVKTFDNGISLVMVNDPSATIASSYVFVRTGSIFENQWLGYGLSHYLEHLISGGTTLQKSETEYRKIIDQLGGASNAFTSYEYTGYYIQSSSENTLKALQVLYEWMAFSNWTVEEFQREKGVVLREMERGKANPSRQIFQRSQMLFYKDSPYRHPIIGYEDLVKKTSMNDLKSYYKLNYVPENMVVIVGGSISENIIIDHFNKTFGSMKQKAPPMRYSSNEKRIISSSNTVVVMDNLKTQRIVIRYPIVSFYHNDVYPLDLLAFIFGNGEQSLLYQEFVVKQKIATNIYVNSITPTYGFGYFEIFVESNENESDVVQKIQAFIDQFKRLKIKEPTLKKAVVQKRAAYILGKDSLQSYVEDIGRAMMMGQNPLFFEIYANQFVNVDTQDINRVVGEYLNEDRRQSYVFKNKSISAYLKPSKTIIRPTSNVLVEGVNLIKVNEINQDVVRLTIHFKGGISEEVPTTNGIGNLTAKLLGKKTKGISRKKFQEKFESKGAILKASLNQNSLTYSLVTTTDNAPELIPLFLKSLIQFDTDLEMFSETKTQILKSINKKTEDWYSSAYEKLKSTIFTNESNERLPISGTAESIKPLNQLMVKKYIEKRLNSSEINIVIQANQPDKFIRSIQKGFKQLKPRSSIQKPKPTFVETFNPNLKIDQAVGVVMRVDLLNRQLSSLSELIQLQLIDALLSGMRYPSGLLHRRLRGNQLVYVVHTYHTKWGGQDALFTYALTKSETLKNVEDIMSKSFEEIQTTITDEQFNLAKSQVLFNFQNIRQSGQSKIYNLIYHKQTFGAFHDVDIFKKQLDKISKKDVFNFYKSMIGKNYILKFNN